MSEPTMPPEDRWARPLTVINEWFSSLSSAARAELRRCRTLEEVELHGEFHRLRWKLPDKLPLDRHQLPLLVGLTAHLREPDAGSTASPGELAMRLGRKVQDKPVFSEDRFRKLMAETELDGLYIQMIRVLRLVNGDVSIGALWKALAYWNTRTRRTWAYAYYESN